MNSKEFLSNRSFWFISKIFLKYLDCKTPSHFSFQLNSLKMAIFLCLVLVFVAVSSQETITDSLLSQQEDLVIGHTFFEEQVMRSRDQLSDFIYADSGPLINSHIEGIASIKSIGEITNLILDQIAETPENAGCLSAVRNRWQLQISRFGQQLAACIDVSNRSNFESFYATLFISTIL